MYDLAIGQHAAYASGPTETRCNMQGDPSALPYAVETVKELVGTKPIFGICMGHQILGQALGSSTFKLKFGHHGSNHPIRFGPSGDACTSYVPLMVTV